MFKMRASVVWLLALVSLTASLIALPALAQESFVVTVGQDKVFTDFNYHNAWFENDPGNPPPWPDQRTAYSEGRVARVSLKAMPGHAGAAQALVGVAFEWNLGQYDWEEVQRWPVKITFLYSYTIAAHWTQWTGSGNAFVGFSGSPAPSYDGIGYEEGTVGSRTRSVTETITTAPGDGHQLTIGDLEAWGRVLYLHAYCQAHSVADQGATNSSSVRIVIKRITIEFECDFSSAPGEPERCFGGIGVRCNGIPGVAPFVKDEKTCEVKGWMSVGSILHDRCCAETNNAGYSCLSPDQGDQSLCYSEWQEAWYNTQCTALGTRRQWRHTFGPYPLANTGDDTRADLRAPRGSRVNPEYLYMCSSGNCRKNKKGETILRMDQCGYYCVCE